MNSIENEHEKEPKFRRNKEEKIKLIINTFQILVEEKGYANVSTNQIAERAGISIGTIYNYFSNKADILNQGFKVSMEDFGDPKYFLEIITKKDPKKATQFINFYLTRHREHFKLNEALDQALVLNQEVFRNLQTNLQEKITQYVQYLRQSNPNFSGASIDVIVKAVMIGINHIDNFVHQYLFRESLFDSDEDLINYLAHVFISTLEYFKV